MNALSLLASFLMKVVRTITLSRVFVWAFTALTFITGFTLYENRKKLVSYFTAPSISNMVGLTFTISPETQKQITSIVEGERRIIGIWVMSADLRLNESRGVFFFGDDVSLSGIAAASEKAGSNRLPIFTNSDANNTEMIKLINGTFSCISFNETLISKIYPELSATVKAVCRSSIPSYYGYFSGFVEMYLSEMPEPERALHYRLIVERLANDIYFQDVITTQRPEKVLPKK